MRSARHLFVLASPPKPIKKKNVERSAEAFAWAYCCVERVQLVQGQPCKACGRLGFSVNAHVMGNDGARRKGHYTTVTSLCGFDGAVIGCHELHDEHHEDFVARFPDFDPAKAAAETEELWQRHQRYVVPMVNNSSP